MHPPLKTNLPLLQTFSCTILSLGGQTIPKHFIRSVPFSLGTYPLAIITAFKNLILMNPITFSTGYHFINHSDFPVTDLESNKPPID